MDLIQAAIKKTYEDYEMHENFTNENYDSNSLYEIVHQ